MRTELRRKPHKGAVLYWNRGCDEDSRSAARFPGVPNDRDRRTARRRIRVWFGRDPIASVTLLSGHGAREKIVELSGVAPDETERRLAAAGKDA